MMQKIVALMIIAWSLDSMMVNTSNETGGIPSEFQQRCLKFCWLASTTAVFCYYWMLSRRCSRSLSLFVNKSGDLAFLTYPACFMPMGGMVRKNNLDDDECKIFVIVPAACAEVEVYAKGFDAAKSPLFDLKPER